MAPTSPGLDDIKLCDRGQLTPPQRRGTHSRSRIFAHPFHGSIAVMNDLTAPLRPPPVRASLFTTSLHSLSAHRSLVQTRPGACVRRLELLRHPRAYSVHAGLASGGALQFIDSTRGFGLLLIYSYCASSPLLSRAASCFNELPYATFIRATLSHAHLKLKLEIKFGNIVKSSQVQSSVVKLLSVFQLLVGVRSSVCSFFVLFSFYLLVLDLLSKQLYFGVYLGSHLHFAFGIVLLCYCIVFANTGEGCGHFHHCELQQRASGIMSRNLNLTHHTKTFSRLRVRTLVNILFRFMRVSFVLGGAYCPSSFLKSSSNFVPLNSSTTVCTPVRNTLNSPSCQLMVKVATP